MLSGAQSCFAREVRGLDLYIRTQTLKRPEPTWAASA